MTNDDVALIESRLRVTLPPEYRDFIIDYLDIDGDTCEIWNQPNQIIHGTDRARLGGLSEINWPHEMVIIGDSGCGDFYCLDLCQLPAPIVCWNHELAGFEFVESSLENWYKKVTETKS